MADDQPIKPANILNIVATNQGRREVTRSRPVARALTPARAQELLAQGHYLVDTRSTAAHSCGHVPGALNVHLTNSEFEQRVGWVVPDDQPMVLLCETTEDAQRAVHNMAFIGLDPFVAGFVEGGMDAWAEAGLPVERVVQMDVVALAHELSTNGVRVLDVREQDEWDDGHIEGSVLMPYTHLAPQLGKPARFAETGLEKDATIAVVCEAGGRSSTAVGLLRREGYTTVYNVTGGINAWKAAGLPMVDGVGRACGI